MFSNMSLKSKLLSLCGTMLFFMLMVGGVSFWGINQMDRSIHKVSNVSLPKIKTADNMYVYYSNIRIALRTLGLPGISIEEENKSVNRVKEMIKNYEEEDLRYQKIAFSNGEENLYSNVKKDWDHFKAIGIKVLNYQKNVSEDDKKKMIEIFLVDCPNAAAAFNVSINNLVKFHENNSVKWTTNAITEAGFIKNLQNIIMAIGVLGGLFIGYFFSRSISKLLLNISENLSFGSEKITTITSEISSVSNSLSASITQQAAVLQETTSAVEETSASVISNAENAKKSSEVSEHSMTSAQNGKVAVEEVMSSIEQISHSIQQINIEIEQNNDEINSIVTVINEIGAKTKIINEIVFQTKLLSFNASVEAARAGENGKGFAVVAQEVGNLAAMSGKSAKEISDLLEKSIRSVELTVENSKRRISSLMVTAKAKVEDGNITAKKCNIALDEIAANFENVNRLVAEISSSSNEQSKSIIEITKAMNEIDSASHLNSSSSQQAKIASDSLGEQVDNFKDLVVKLNTFIEGKKSA